MKLDLNEFVKINHLRDTNCFNTPPDTLISYFGNGLAGEVGELCNMIKKIDRVKLTGVDIGHSYKASDITKHMLEEEVGGIMAYLCHICHRLDIDIEDAIINSFNAVSEEQNMPYRYIAHNSDIIKENIELKIWKQEASELIRRVDLQEISEVLELPLGKPISEQIIPAIKELKKQLNDCKRTSL